MLNWLKKVAPTRASTLERRLVDYPAYDLPHPGGGETLTLLQAQGNLHALMTQRESRLKALTTLLRDEAAIDIEPVLAGAEPGALLDALHLWMNEVMPALHDQHAALASSARWLGSKRNGDEIVFSFLSDLGLLLGELITLGRPNFQWALDLAPRNGRARMLSWRRPVLLAHRPDGSQVVLDVEDLVVHRFVQPRGSALVLNEWGRVVQDARCGLYDRAL
ncbi:hypothetical protein [Variovorax sp. 160MFSha2.1]|uniref:hypothetical protein n=1 Tax=Variovorax sp. 160MFSha2.1 TaxID=3158367 RepID=UPI003AAE85E0